MTGYMPCDVLGQSAYQYIHSSDVPVALFAQKAMFASSDGTGIITYRLKIQNSSFIYLQSKGQIRYKDSAEEIRQFICCNMLLSSEDGLQEQKKFQDRFAPQFAASEIATAECLKRRTVSGSKISKVDKSKNVYKHSTEVPIDTDPSNGLQTKCEIRKNDYQHDFIVGNSVTSQSYYEPHTIANAFEATSIEVQKPIICNNKVESICDEVLNNFQSSFNFNKSQNFDHFNSLHPPSTSLSNEICLSSPNIQECSENSDYHQLKNGCVGSLQMVNRNRESFAFSGSDLFLNSDLISETSSFEENSDQLVSDKYLSNFMLKKHNFIEMEVVNAQNTCAKNNIDFDTNNLSMPQTTFQSRPSLQQNCFIQNKTWSASKNMHNIDFITDVVRTSDISLASNGVNNLSLLLSETLFQEQSMSLLKDTCNEEMVSQHNLDFLDQTVDELSLLND